ncbi:unnamed protein product [Rotaria sordida]|uniref:PID domain-containing protein n=1 Tax=Rotaria sordida TaxID=392033 RepID=A0A814ZPJ9_9BILA|nr:unnamed protein product [Rotaria sordida]
MFNEFLPFPYSSTITSYTKMADTQTTVLTTKEDEAKKATTTTNGSNAKKFEGEGLPFKAKLIGMEDLSIDRDEKICLDSMFKLKAVVRARGEHKQKVQLTLTMSAVKVIDETTKAQIATHEIERISFVVIDPRDTRAFGYIYNTSDDRHQFWAIKTERAAAATVLALKELFELAFEQYTNAENAKQPNQPTVTSTQAPTSNTPASPTVQTPPVQAPPPNVPVSTPEVDLFGSSLPKTTTTTPLLTSAPPPAAATASLFDDNIWETTPTTTVTQTTQPSTDHLFAFSEQPPTVTQQQPPKTVDSLDDLFSGMPTVPQSTTSTGPSNTLFGMFPNTTPTPAPAPTNQYSNFYGQPTQQNVLNATPAFNQPQPMAFTPMSPQQQQQQPNLLNPSPVSPVAPPTVTSPFAGLDILGGLSAPSTTAAKTTRDAFFPQAASAKTIQQMQMEKQFNGFFRS